MEGAGLPTGGTVIFGVHGFPQTARADSSSVCIPLMPRLSAFARYGACRIFSPSAGLSFATHQVLQDELDERWTAFCADRSGMGTEHHQYEFAGVVTNLILWRWIIRRALAVLAPTEIILPERCKEQKVHIASQLDLLDWLPYGLLAEECAGRNLSYGVENVPPRAAVTDGSRARLVANAFRLMRGARLVVARAQFHASQSVLTPQAPDGSRRPRGAKGERTALFMAQFAKVETVLRRRPRGVRMKFLHYDTFHSHVQAAPGSRPEADLRSADSVDDSVMQFLTMLVRAGQAAEPQLAQMAAGAWDALVTDAQHDPLMRRLVESATSIGKEVATIPEGAISYVDELARFGGSSIFITNPEVTRFVLDDKQASAWMNLGIPADRVEVTGFLGNTATTPAVEAFIGRRLLRWLAPGPSTRPTGSTVMLSFDVFFMHVELSRFGQPTQSETLDHLLQISEILLNAGHRVLAKTRDRELAALLGAHFGRADLLLTVDIPWQTLADASSMVITRDSSIGWESLSRGKPVLVWNFSDYPAFTEITLRGSSPNWVRVARSLSELEVGIQGLLDADRVRRERSSLSQRTAVPPLASRPEVVEQWLTAQGNSLR